MRLLAKLFGQKKPAGKRANITGVDRDKIREWWVKIEELKNLNKPSALSEAVIEADKLVNLALDRIYPGKENAAERLKEAKAIFSTYKQDYENLWYAHKLRNEMVHTVGFELPSLEAKNILEYFKRALEILGVL
ncbi:MAG: hypothetical protein A2126_03050 [Candidatus Woykebacteria bacterium GWB1_45_5]|uniref:DUF4145 domain-containing protein n=2 Tax=Candidatus Woykeibacteriota TaxID=1817899 RepID=A0A1G1W005_9BACT|nr:MAG: hypothetical protein A2113_01575 [Candidatus Woykebacteria bacterium GWA1_44_8]OGY23563.1 MAG: hypothetical protein A2126_03050 [Candidatus Woykebacteria bacterium GWB1_45_5]